MTTRHHGIPCWYELATSEGNLQRAEDFYGAVFGWKFADAGMQGFDYHLASCEDDKIAGLMAMPQDMAAMKPFWMIYFAVDDADRLVNAVKAAGGSIHREAADIPGTGRFAVLADPQGAAFGILQPDMSAISDADRAKAEAGEGAFNQAKAGHGNWIELMSTDPDAAFSFYSKLLDWTKGTSVDMGAMGAYQLFQHKNVDIGGMMGLGDAPVPNWLPYFGVTGRVSDTIDVIKSAGGTIHHGPAEVPGGAFIAVGQDPQGAWFAIVGSAK